MYYNEEAKEKFIKDYMRSRVVSATSLSAIFNKTAPFEEELNKDCSQFTQKEILNMYTAFKARSVNVLENYNVYLKNYTAYVLYHNKTKHDNEYFNLTKEMISTCIDPNIRKQIYLTREQMDDIENELLNYTDRSIVVALWHGISGKSMQDLISLNRDKFNDDKTSLIFPDGRIVQISHKLSEYLDKAFSETEYLCYGNTLKIERLNGYDCLYKERFNAHAAPSEDQQFRWIYRKIQNYRKHLDIPMLTMKTIQASGLLYALQTEMKTNNMSMKEVLASEKGKVLALQYGYKVDHYIDVILDKYHDIKG